MNGLDLYAKVEYLFDFEEVMQFLWGKYIEELKKLNVQKILDIGCGSGGFMEMAQKEGFEIVGIDISEQMVKNGKQKGLKVFHKNLCEVDEKFDACVAIFDVVNYLNDKELKQFLKCVKNVLNKGGYFIFDINSFYGFDEIAQGTISVEDKDNFAVLNSLFDGEKMETNITLFENKKECYKKEEGSIIQYFHKINKIKKLTPLKFVEKIDINLYDGELPDKEVLIFKLI